MNKTVLVVEDDHDIAKGLRHNLRFEGYEVHIAQDGEQGLNLALTKKPDLILLDIMLPKMNGFEVLREIRRQDPDTPIIMLTAKGEEIDIVRGLELGADDYVTKPFRLSELLARINASLRRKKQFDKSIEQLSFGEVTVDFAARTVSVQNEPISLTTRELDLLYFLISKEGKAVDRQGILNQVWGFDYYGTDRTVDNFINRLRQKLEPDPNSPKHFLTVRGVGYRFQR
ncbi:MAG: response regulator transcription factor [Proteobacteria bacterium]|nr:response regulator transcription factor [Pseudomonadota bacterium]